MKPEEPTATNDNTPATRDATFDARVAAYMPGLRKLAYRYPSQEADDLVQDTMVVAMQRHATFSEEHGLWNWLKVQMRIAAGRNRERAGRVKRAGINVALEDYDQSTPATQEDYADLSAALGRLAGTRHGDVVVQRAMGWTCAEIASERGVSKQRVHQMESAARGVVAA